MLNKFVVCYVDADVFRSARDFLRAATCCASKKARCPLTAYYHATRKAGREQVRTRGTSATGGYTTLYDFDDNDGNGSMSRSKPVEIGVLDTIAVP